MGPRIGFELVVVVSRIFTGVAEEPGALPESGGAGPAQPFEEQRRFGTTSIPPLVQAMLCWRPARVELAEVSPESKLKKKKGPWDVLSGSSCCHGNGP